MKILFLASEAAPFAKTGGLGDVAQGLPAALAALGHEVMVVTPRYQSVPASHLEALGASIRLRFPFGEERADLLAAEQGPGHEVVFLDHPGFYQREGLYGGNQGDYADNHRRFAFFAMGALAAAQRLQFEPDVVHLNDWQAGLAAPALRRGYAQSALGKARVVFTIHNLAYQGLFPKEVMNDLGMPWDLFLPDGLEFHDNVSFMKAGLAYSDVLTTVSPRYAQEIQTPEMGCDLDGFLRARSDRLVGILNGVDEREWDPARDPALTAPYSSQDQSGKTACGVALRERFGLARTQRPLFGMVGRLTPQKGVELALQVLPGLLEQDGQCVVLGSGDAEYERELAQLAERFPGRLGLQIGFDTSLAHLVEAGSDFFLMPSLFEPCGLNQMYSLRYGTPPIVRAVGGLDDSVVDISQPGGTGIKFHDFRPEALRFAVDRARALFAQPERLREVRARGMQQRFSWTAAAERYLASYGTGRASG